MRPDTFSLRLLGSAVPRAILALQWILFRNCDRDVSHLGMTIDEVPVDGDRSRESPPTRGRLRRRAGRLAVVAGDLGRRSGCGRVAAAPARRARRRPQRARGRAMWRRRCSSRFHLEITADDGGASLVQLAGRLPVTVDGVLVDAPLVLDGDGHTLDVGASRLVLRAQRARRAEHPPLQLGVTVSGRRSVVRRGRVVPTWEPPEIPMPVDRGGSWRVLGAASCPLCSRSPAPGRSRSSSTSRCSSSSARSAPSSQCRHGRRSAAGSSGRGADPVARPRRQRRPSSLRSTSSGLRTCGTTGDRRDPHRRDRDRTPPRRIALGAVVPTHPDPFTVSLGLGDVTWQPVLAGDERSLPSACWSTVEQASHPRRRGGSRHRRTGARVAVCGPHGAAVVSSLVAQLAVQAGPGGVAAARRQRATRRGGRTGPMLPHARDGSTERSRSSTSRASPNVSATRGSTVRSTSATARGGRRRRARSLSARTSPIRRLLAAERVGGAARRGGGGGVGAGGVHVACSSPSADGRASWTEDTTTGELPATAAGRRAVRRGCDALSPPTLSGFADPEDPADSRRRHRRLTSRSRHCSTHVDPAAIAAAWAARRADVAPETPARSRGRRRRRGRPRPRRPARAARRDHRRRQERAAPQPRRRARDAARAGADQLRPRRLQGWCCVRRLCTAAARRRAS